MIKHIIFTIRGAAVLSATLFFVWCVMKTLLFISSNNLWVYTLLGMFLLYVSWFIGKYITG